MEQDLYYRTSEGIELTGTYLPEGGGRPEAETRLRAYEEAGRKPRQEGGKV